MAFSYGDDQRIEANGQCSVQEALALGRDGWEFESQLWHLLMGWPQVSHLTLLNLRKILKIESTKMCCF